MPLEFAGGGVLGEHAAVREAVGLFDVSHLGKARVAGPGAADYVNRCLTADLARIAPGRAQYTMCCEPATGGVVDDLLAYLIGPDEVFLIPNAANTAEVVHRLADQAPDAVAVRNEHDDWAVLAVQGPRSALVLNALGLPADLEYMSFASARFAGKDLLVCRSGYTGEHGYELLPAAADAPALWAACLAEVAAAGGLACGLAARDTLRTEMGYPLHGQDLGAEITPVQARAGWAVGWRKPEFWGRSALLAERESGPRRQLWGLQVAGAGIPRPGMSVRGSDGAEVGVLTSGTFSPTLRVGIGLALLERGLGPGDFVEVDVRGRPAQAEVVRPPFVERSPA